MWTRQTFEQNLQAALPAYVQNHDWFNQNDFAEQARQRGDQNRFRPYIAAAWAIYRNVGNLGLDFILLGDTEIRKQTKLLRNFGIVSSNTNPQDPEVVPKIQDSIRFRRGVVARTRPGIYSPRGVVSTTETGSILSTMNWSPMLNDAMILGGISRGIDFHYTLNENESAHFDWLRYQYDKIIRGKIGNEITNFIAQNNNRPPNPTELAQIKRVFKQRKAPELWQAALKSNPHALWKDGLPRVFIRELLGLKFFGYEAKMDSQQLLFVRPQVPIPGAANMVGGFDQYLLYLQNSGYFQNDRNRLIRIVSDYLFDSTDMLTSLQGDNDRVHI